jgi:hypothetical protein
MSDIILIFTSTSNVGAKLPARVEEIFCIGSADGLGILPFNPLKVLNSVRPVV